MKKNVSEMKIRPQKTFIIFSQVPFLHVAFGSVFLMITITCTVFVYS